MRFHFVGGKGGVGKTSYAAMVALSASGRRLLVTTDPASSLSSALGQPVGAEPVAVRGARGLVAANVDAAAAFERWLAPRKEQLAAIALRGTYLDADDVARLLKLSLPGIDEVIGLLDIVRMVRDAPAPYDRVIVDTAPTGHTLRLLASPVLLTRVAGVLDTLQAHHRTVVSALRGSYRADAADALIHELDREGEALAAMLRDREATTVSWVTLPEPMALEETADAIDALEEAGIHVGRLVVNRMTPPASPVAPKPRGGDAGFVAPKPLRGHVGLVAPPGGEGGPVAPEPRGGEGGVVAPPGGGGGPVAPKPLRGHVGLVAPPGGEGGPVAPKPLRGHVGLVAPRGGDAGFVAPKPLRGHVGLVAPPGGEGGCGFCDARRRFEARALAPIARRFQGREIVALPEADDEPIGINALRSLHARARPWTPPVAMPPIEHRVRAELPAAADLPLEGGSHTSARASGRQILPAIGGNARWILFGGKGGVGKSTCAAAAAVLLAEDRRVLLLSTDPAHSLGDVFGAGFGNEPRRAPGAPPTLHVREIDARAEMDRFRRRYVDAVDDAFTRIARAAGGDQDAFRELIDLAPPGIDEVIAVADVAAAVTGGTSDYDVIVTDTAPTGHALRLLQTPEVLREWTQALMAILVKYREIVGAGTLAALLVQLSKRLRGLAAVLRDPAQTRFTIVTRAAALPIAETRSLIASLGALGIPVGTIVVNAMGGGTCGRCRTRASRDAAAISRLRRVSRGAYAIIGAPADVPPPHGAAALAGWGLAWRRLA